MAKDDPKKLAKAIKDVPVGRHSEALGHWDYSHLLKPEHRKAGYELLVHLGEDNPAYVSASLHQRGVREGKVFGQVILNGKALEPHASPGLPPELRGKGFGVAMYEALYAHAKKKMGVKKVSGGYHTKDARRVHESLARKHGLEYDPEPGKGQPSERRGGPYEYMLKDELPLVKGAMQRLAPFDPSKERLPEHEEAAIATWQGPDREERASGSMPPNARVRALHRLSGATKVRRNAEGEREFLLHRGVSPEEHQYATAPENITHPDVVRGTIPPEGFVNHEGLSSWTPRYQLARGFGSDYRENTGKPMVLSAWVPESAINVIPKQMGHLDPYADFEGDDENYKPPRGSNQYGNEHEVMVLGGHNSRRATPDEVAATTQRERLPIGMRPPAYARLDKPNPEWVKGGKGYYERMAHKMGKAEFPANAMMKAPAFRHTQTGAVIESPGFHDVGNLPPGEDTSPYWEDGFVDHAGKFYNRHEAAAAVDKKTGPQFTRLEGQPLESQWYRQGVGEGFYKSERDPTWVKHPTLPARIQRAFDAVRANLSPDLLGKDVGGRDWRDPEVRGSSHPLAGHCYVATEALWHLLDGKRTGWERMHLPSAEGPHWFLKHKKTGVILDPTAEQYDERPAYENARAKGFSVGPPDYDPTKPSKRAQLLIDRTQAGLKKAEEEDEYQELAKTVGYITFPKMGVTKPQEPMSYGKGQGPLARGRKGRDIFAARMQLANLSGSASESEGAAHRSRSANVHDVTKRRGMGVWSSFQHPNKPTPPEQRTATGMVLGGKIHGFVGTRAHEAQHAVFGQLAQKYGSGARAAALSHIVSKLSPEGLEAGKRVMAVSGYSFGLDPEEFVTSHQQFLIDPHSRRNIYKVLAIPPKEQRQFFKLMRQNFEHMRQVATQMSPRVLKKPRLPSKMKKSEAELAKSIAAISPGRILAHNPVTNESLHDYSHVLPPQLQQEGWKLRLQHIPRIGSLVARVYDPANQHAGGVTTYHDIEDGEPVLGVDTAHIDPEHRGRGLGTALYEANYAFARRNLRVRKVVGQEHSYGAHRVHEALARKHGLAYEVEPSLHDPDTAPPYEYMLKQEVKEDEGSVYEMVKSEFWSPQDWEEYEQVLSKADGQLSLFPDLVPPGEAAQEAAKRDLAARVAAGERLPPRVWGATWHERAEKGQLYPEEVDDFLRRIGNPKMGTSGVHDRPELIWDGAATETRPALTNNNVYHFLNAYFEKLSPEQRALVVNSPHGDVSDWTHYNHPKLTDDEFKKILPTLSVVHFGYGLDNLTPHRLAIAFDEAKKISRPAGRLPEAGDWSDYDGEVWYPWRNAWDTISDMVRYNKPSNELAIRVMNEFPKDHPTHERALHGIVSSGALTEEQMGKVLDDVDRNPQSTAWAHNAFSRAVGERAQTPALQVKALKHALVNGDRFAASEMLQRNPRVSPEMTEIAFDSGTHALKGLVQNPALPHELLSKLAKHKDKEIRLSVAQHPAASEELLREMANDRHGTVRKAVDKALSWHDPSSVHDEHVDVKFGTNKLRQIRDYIGSKGVDTMSPKELPPGDWSAGRDKGGNISAKRIQEHIDSLPSIKYGVSEGVWRGMQRHNREPSYVFQLNLSTDQVKKLKDAGVYETFRRMHEAMSSSNHPIGHAGIGWVRWTGGDKGIHIDEVQSDLGQSFVKQAANQAREAGQNPEEAAAQAQGKYPEEHFQKIKDIVFGGKHPSEVLQEAFHEYLRQEKKPDKTGYNRHTGTTFRFGGRKSHVGVPVHIWQPQSKATISLHHAKDKPLPGHFMVGYRDVPQKKMGMKPGKYGDLYTQDARKHQGKPTWTDELRKNDDQRAVRPHYTFQEHALPAQLSAEGYRLNIAHAPGVAVATVHRHGKVVGHVELKDWQPVEEWKESPRHGLSQAVARILTGHVKGEQEEDGWNHVTPGPKLLSKAEPGDLKPETPPGFHEQPQGHQITVPHQTYTAAAAAKPKGQQYLGGKNIHVRQHHEQSNAGRTLMVQFSSDLLQGDRKRDQSDDYYDNLYAKREGYHRGEDWWEVPQWQAHIAHSMPNVDHYTVRDPQEAIEFLKNAGYKNAAFSSLDVTAPFIRQLAEAVPGQNIAVGGYSDMNAYAGLPNVKVHPTVKAFVESEGHEYKPGYDYRHFSGTKVIPRLTLSDGCRHNCTFCCVPKKVVETPMEEVEQQADAFAQHLPSDLIYLNDKTFGQAPNHAQLPALYQRIKAKNPGFKGFVVQTTAAQMKNLSPEFLRNAGIRHVELGIESVNDPILRAHKKPANEALIEEATQRIRQAGASLIPNIMIGLPGEDRGTYGRTMAWLEKNRDIISHVNAYNLALYDESELGKKLNAVNQADRDENQAVKSWHTDPQAHRDFAQRLFQFGNEQLDRPIGHSELAQPIAKSEANLQMVGLLSTKGENAHKEMGELVPSLMDKGELAPLRPHVSMYAPSPDRTSYLTYESPEGHHAMTPEGNEQWFATPEKRDAYIKWHAELKGHPLKVRDLGLMKTEDPHPPLAASVLAYNEHGQVLWGQRRKDGKWTLPGGHLEPGEDPATGAIRELYEEAGVTPDVIRHVTTSNTDAGIPVFVFVAHVNGQAPHGNFDPDHEVAEWRWVDCFQGLPPEIAGNLAHPRNVVAEHLGWTI